jgi:hypothetical protein
VYHIEVKKKTGIGACPALGRSQRGFEIGPSQSGKKTELAFFLL